MHSRRHTLRTLLVLPLIAGWQGRALLAMPVAETDREALSRPIERAIRFDLHRVEKRRSAILAFKQGLIKGAYLVVHPDGYERVVFADVIVDNSHVSHAQVVAVDTDQLTREKYLIQVSLTPEGARAFADATELLYDKTIGIFLDDGLTDEVLVQGRVTAGRFQFVVRNRSYAELQNIANGISVISI
ncbi:SecDF P1 head subdomain-containing protein [Ampullimonas aquatilis]|uniref:SecDF P1 head subdomain-containing protein n=1 Tax=Ampullimonas aquatilis TaxID=1341549 RepID=UPI003C777821